MQNDELVKNIHRLGLENPPDELGNDFAIVKGDYQYYHYLCDQYDDRGWGCGYRTLQELVKKYIFANLVIFSRIQNSFSAQGSTDQNR